MLIRVEERRLPVRASIANAGNSIAIVNLYCDTEASESNALHNMVPASVKKAEGYCLALHGSRDDSFMGVSWCYYNFVVVGI